MVFLEPVGDQSTIGTDQLVYARNEAFSTACTQRLLV